MNVKVYLSVPMIANRELERARLMAEVIEGCGHTLTSPWVLGAIEPSSASAVNAFKRDKEAVEASDAIVADLSQPSIGVGMELMAAYQAKKRIILVAKTGTVTSRMLMHMDDKVLVEFEGDSDLEERLRRALGGFETQ